MDWEPIETVPHNETVLLLHITKFGGPIVYSGEWYVPTGVVGFEASDCGWLIPVMHLDDFDEDPDFMPDFWMLLPKIPETAY
jgi:hypothetical protein